MALPLAIAFAIASGLTPDRGLYTAVIAGLIISAFGGSRVQIGGPTGAFVVIVYGIVQRYGVDGLMVATIMAARAHDLDDPHWTLQYIGVRGTRRGTGLGQAAVGAMLERCDAERLPAALVSTNPRTVGFYERLGFRVVGEVATPDGAATLRPMHRPAASEATGTLAR